MDAVLVAVAVAPVWALDTGHARAVFGGSVCALSLALVAAGTPPATRLLGAVTCLVAAVLVLPDGAAFAAVAACGAASLWLELRGGP